VKIVDFGIAGLATNFDVSKIDAGSLKYMAPEIFSKKLKKIGPHIDIWALGVILYGMVTGQLPFDGENQLEIISAIQNQTFNLPKDLYVSNEIKDLI
jgi:serine/threonine protein kinase